MAAPVNLQGAKFPSPGRCIYCGGDGKEGGLGDEHIIPYALAGDVVLKNASCKTCESKTSYISGHVSRRIFATFKSELRVKPRRKRAAPLRIDVTFEKGGQAVVRQFNAADFPQFVMLPKYFEPMLMDPTLRPSHIDEIRFWRADHFNSYLDSKCQPGEEWTFNPPGNFDPFCRLLAQIAHGLVICNFGIDSFVPYLPKYILGNGADFRKLIGNYVPCRSDKPFFPQETATNTPGSSGIGKFNTWQARCNIIHVDDIYYVSCAIQLFPIMKMPVYRVLVGEPTQALFDRLSLKLRARWP